MEITVFKKEHQQQVLELIVNIQRIEFGLNITAEQQPDLNKIESFYQTGKGNFWVATINNSVIGTIALLDIGNGDVALRKMFVKEAYRGRKYEVATSLLNECLDWCREQDVKHVYLGTTPKFLAAHRFYEKHQFVEVASAELPESFPIMHVDKKFYVYTV